MWDKDINKFLIFEHHEKCDEDNIVTKFYLTFDVDLVNYMDMINDDKKIITIKCRFISQSHIDDELMSWHLTSDSFGLDIELADKEKIYGIANQISCGFLNCFQKIFKNPKKINGSQIIEPTKNNKVNINDYEKIG